MEITDLEESLMNLEDFKNEDQLHILCREIQYIISNKVQPTPEWYTLRADKIYTYADLEWNTISYQYFNKDETMWSMSERILSLLDKLIKELESNITFDIMVYYELLESIKYIWNYYNSKYIGGEDDGDVLDIIRDLTHL